MKPITLIWIGFFLIGLCFPLLAQPDGKTYTLDQLYQKALDHAEKIGIAEEEVAVAKYLRKQALSVLIPTLTTFGNYQYYSEKKEADGSLIQPQWDSSYGVAIGQSFTLNGRELTALKIAEQSIERSDYDLHSAKEIYLYNVASAFFDVAKSRQAVQIAQASVKRLTTYKEAVSTRLNLGDVSKTELFRTEAELASANAELLKSQNVQKLARAFLARLTGVDMPIKIVEQEISGTQPEITNLNELIKAAFDHRAELKSDAQSEAIALKQIKYVKGAYWPRVEIKGSYTFFEQDPEAAISLEDSGSIGASLTWDIFDGGLRSSQVSEARSRHKQARLSLEDAKRDVAVQVEEALLNWQTQQSVIASFESSLRYAQENYDASIRLFENGMANSVDVMDANTLLVTSQRQLAEARYNLQLAVLGIERSTGMFLSTIESRIFD